MTAPRDSIASGSTAVVVAAFLGVLGYYLVQPGYSQTRLVFFIVLGGLAVLGAAGVIFQRERVAVSGAGGLLLVGFWQAVLWVYIFPVVVVLFAATFSMPKDHSSDPIIH